MDITFTARRSSLQPDYYIIYFNGEAKRVCHISNLSERYPTATILN
jgi:hypothetical protein